MASWLHTINVDGQLFAAHAGGIGACSQELLIAIIFAGPWSRPLMVNVSKALQPCLVLPVRAAPIHVPAGNLRTMD